MSDGHYCLVRDLGPVKGGKGLKHHEVVVDFSYRGIRDLSKRGASTLIGRLSAKFSRRRTVEPLPEADMPEAAMAEAAAAELAEFVRELDVPAEKPSRKTRAA